MRRIVVILGVALLGIGGVAWSGCNSTADPQDEPNPFLEDQSNLGKADSAYLNPDGIEVEVDLEADVQATSYRIHDAPADLGSFALTYLRKRDEFYLESLAEDANSGRRVEWLVNGAWVSDADSRTLDAALLTHFRIRGINAVLLHGAGTGVTEGTFFNAKIPINPYTVMTEAGDTCADPDDHMGLDSSIYWYQWNPDRSGCVMPTQEATLTVSKMFRTEASPYLEYDKLVADGKITAVILFGQIGDGAVTGQRPGDAGLQSDGQVAQAGGLQGGDAGARGQALLQGRGRRDRGDRPLLALRLLRALGHGPLQQLPEGPVRARDRGLRRSQHARRQRLLEQADLPELLPDLPVRWLPRLRVLHPPHPGGERRLGEARHPLLRRRGERDANQYAGPFLAKLLWAIENGNKVSWKDYLVAIRNRVGDSTFGASGVRDNCYSPTGSLCTTPVDPTSNHEYVSETAVAIPDDDAAGASSVLNVPDSFTVGAASVSLSVTHTWVGDLKITLEHAGTTVVLWDNEGGSSHDLVKTFSPEAFAGKVAQGDWTLKLVDNAGADVGTLQNWSLVLGAQ